MNEESLFAKAIGIPDAAERATFLDRECAGNPELRREVEELLAAHLNAAGFLRRPGLTVAYANAAPPTDLKAVGPYKLLQKIGEGGMGAVYMAEQEEPVRRRVAVKIIKAGMDSDRVVARFEAERQALALMDHPNIAKVLDAGTIGSDADPSGRLGGVRGDGRPYFVMELVKGVPITKFCDDNKLTPRERLELFVPVCQAIQHAHQKGVIHRDIKPSNVLVTLYDGKPVPKVIDFGVAKATQQRLTERTLFTEYGALIGTPEYMSPEQAEMNALDIDTRSDVYSLGVLLYELLTGFTPIDRNSIRDAGYVEMLRLIREVEPPRPSDRVSGSREAAATISEQRKTDAAKLSNLMKGELDWIVMKALEKDRNRRYDSAAGFAADVGRYLASEPVQAVPPTFGYRMRKAYRKNRAAVLTATAFAILLLVGTGLSLWQAGRAILAEVGEKGQRIQAEKNLEVAEAETNRAIKSEIDAVRARNEAAAERDRVRALFLVSTMNLVQVAHAEHRPTRLRELLAELRPAPGQDDIRGFEWHYLDRMLAGRFAFRLSQRLPQGTIRPVVTLLPGEGTPFSGERSWVSTTHPTGSSEERPKGLDPWKGQWGEYQFNVYDMRTAARVFGHTVRGPSQLVTFAINRGGWAAVCLEQKVTIFNLTTGQATRTIDLDQPAEDMVINRDATRLALVFVKPPDKINSLPEQTSLAVWDVAANRPVYSVPAPKGKPRWIQQMAFNPAGNRLAVTSDPPGSVTIHTEGADKRVTIPLAGSRYAWVNSDRLLTYTLSGAKDELTLWDAATGQSVRTITGLPPQRSAVVMSPDERWLAVGERSGLITLRDLTNQQPTRTLWGHESPVERVGFLDGGNTLFSSSTPGHPFGAWEYRLHDLAGTEVCRFPGSRQVGPSDWSYSGDCSRVATLAVDGPNTALVLWETSGVREAARLPISTTPEEVKAQVQLNANGTRAAVLTTHAAAFGTRGDSYLPPRYPFHAFGPFPGPAPVVSGDLAALALSARRFLPVVERVRVWDATANRVLFDRSRERDPNTPWSAPELSPNGRYLFLRDHERWSLFDVETGEETVALPNPDPSPPEKTGPDLRRVLSHLSDERLLLTVVTPGEGRTDRIEFRWWDSRSGKPLGTQTLVVPGQAGKYAGQLSHIVTSPDRRRAAVISPTRDDTGNRLETWLRVFEIAPDRLKLLLEGNAEKLTGNNSFLLPHFSPDARLLALSSPREIHVLNLDQPTTPVRLTGLRETAREVAISPDGRRLVALDGSFAQDQTQHIRIWDLRTGRELLTLPSSVRGLRPRFVGHRLHVIGLPIGPGLGAILWTLDGTPREGK